MSQFDLIWQEIQRYFRTHQPEASDFYIAIGVGIVILVVVTILAMRKGDSVDVRSRWILVALEPGSRTDSIVEAFRKKSWDVQILPESAGLGEFLAGFNPSLLLVDQGKYGNELTRLESTEAKVASTPILFLDARQVDRTVVPMRAWLPRNAKIKLILEKADKLIKARPGLQQLSRKAEVEGPLSAGTLLELLYFQANTQRTGRVEVSDGHHSGWIWIQSGEVRHAIVGRAESVEALHVLLDLPRGKFSFVADVPSPKTTIKEPTVFLMHEYARQKDERGKMAGD